jgi:hypothetical protein
MEEYREIGKKADVRKPAQEANEAASMGVKFSHLAID